MTNHIMFLTRDLMRRKRVLMAAADRMRKHLEGFDRNLDRFEYAEAHMVSARKCRDFIDKVLRDALELQERINQLHSKK